MKTFLFTWSKSSRGWPYPELQALVKQYETDGTTLIDWSCISRKKAQTGDRVFFMKQGEDPKGLFGSGRIALSPELNYQNPYYAKVSFDVLVDPVKTGVLIPLAELETLHKQTGLWNNQSSGVEIPADVALRLEDLWTKKTVVSPPLSNGPESPFEEAPQMKQTEAEHVHARSSIAHQDQDNKALGDAGEQFVLNLEKARLIKAGRPELAEKVVWVARVRGAVAGYDIQSFETNGREIHIEVKTTNGGQRTPFYITRNEMKFAQQNPATFRLYRVHSFQKGPNVFILCYPLEDSATIEPEIFRVLF